MDTLYFLNANDKQIGLLEDQLQNRVFNIESFDNLFKLKQHTSKEKPDLIFVADNLREKNLVDLVNAVHEIEGLANIPLIGLITGNEGQAVTTFLRNGAVDVLKPPYDLEEIIARVNLRLQEASLQKRFTSGEFFFNEAQEKEQAKRTGIFKFFDDHNIEVGNICIKEGRVVHATYGSLIKEDAALQLACNTELKFIFEDTDAIPHVSINEGITNLLLEASKLKDEIKRQEGEELGETKAIVIDENRIARILASRVLRNFNIICKITSPKEMTVRFMANFAPQLLVIDYMDADEILDKLWPTPRKETDIPVIIYCDDDIKDINFDHINKHKITATIYKNRFHKEIKDILQNVKLIN
jgi:CheY-like chemotaxis protein